MDRIGSEVRVSASFYRAILCIARLCCRSVSVCLSVCMSVTRWYSVETATCIIKLFFIVVFPHQTVWQYSDGDSLNVGVECAWYVF